MRPDGRRGELALVEALVGVADVLDAQLPEVRHRHVLSGEAKVRRVGVPAHAQEVRVLVTDPGDLGRRVLVPRGSGIK